MTKEEAKAIADCFLEEEGIAAGPLEHAYLDPASERTKYFELAGIVPDAENEADDHWHLSYASLDPPDPENLIKDKESVWVQVNVRTGKAWIFMQL